MGWGRREERCNNRSRKSGVVSDSEPDAGVKAGMASLGGAMTPKQVFNRWLDWSAERLERRAGEKLEHDNKLGAIDAAQRDAMDKLAEQERRAMERIAAAAEAAGSGQTAGEPEPPYPQRDTGAVKKLLKKKAKSAGKMAVLGKNVHAGLV